MAKSYLITLNKEDLQSLIFESVYRAIELKKMADSGKAKVSTVTDKAKTSTLPDKKEVANG